METNMAEEAITTVAADLPEAGPASDALTIRQGDEAIAALLGDPDELDLPNDSQKGNDASDAPPKEEDDDDLTVDPDAKPEDVESEEAAGNDEPSHADGQFVPDGGKVKMPDGSTISVA